MIKSYISFCHPIQGPVMATVDEEAPNMSVVLAQFEGLSNAIDKLDPNGSIILKLIGGISRIPAKILNDLVMVLKTEEVEEDE